MLSDIKHKLDKIQIRELIQYAVFPDPERFEQTLTEYKSNDDLEIFALEEEGEIIGMIGVRKDDQNLEVRHIAVQPELRGLGYGRGLILELIALKKPKEIIAETDEDAVDFYRSVGFTIHSLGEKYPGVERFECRFDVEETAH